MKRYILLIALSILASLLMARCAKPPQAQNAEGFVQNQYGQRVSWKDQTPIEIYYDASVPQQYYGDVEAAMHTWELAIGHPVFKEMGVLPSSSPSQDGRNVIYWMSQWESDNSSQQANTTIYWVANQITEADVTVNAAYYYLSDQSPLPANAIDVQSLLLHELGHVLGLKHVYNIPSVMAPSLADAQSRQSLFAGDVTDVQSEY